MVSRGIWQTGLQNLAKFSAEKCGPYSFCFPVFLGPAAMEIERITTSQVTAISIEQTA